VKLDRQNLVISFVILKFGLLKLSFSDRWSRGTRLWERDLRTEGIRFQNGYGVVVWMGENDTKAISVDANLFENGAKQLPFRLKTD